MLRTWLVVLVVVARLVQTGMHATFFGNAIVNGVLSVAKVLWDRDPRQLWRVHFAGDEYATVAYGFG